MRALFFAFSLVVSVPTLGASQIPSKPEETFSARAEANAADGMAATMLRIHVDRYSTDTERDAALTAFEAGGAAGLTTALRKTPATGYVEVGDRRWPIRYARQEPTPNGRRMVFVVDQPMSLPAGREVNASRREGFEHAVIQVELDETGTGQGTMAAAARIRAGGPAGVELTDCSDGPIVLVAVTKIPS